MSPAFKGLIIGLLFFPATIGSIALCDGLAMLLGF